MSLVEDYLAEHLAIRADLNASVDAVWWGLGSWRDEDLDVWLATIVPEVHAAQAETAALLDATVAELVDGDPLGIDPTRYIELRDLPDPDVYRRPFVETWTKLGDGADVADALRAGRDRAVDLATTDTQLAARQYTIDVDTERPGRIRGWRRVLNTPSCRFCAAASTQIYTRSALMPLHAHCDCGIAPVAGGRDPALTHNKGVLRELKKEGPDYWKRSGFVDADGNPVDPTTLTRLPPKQAKHNEMGTTIGPHKPLDRSKLPAPTETADDLATLTTAHGDWARGHGWDIDTTAPGEVVGRKADQTVTWQRSGGAWVIAKRT